MSTAAVAETEGDADVEESATPDAGAGGDDAKGAVDVAVVATSIGRGSEREYHSPTPASSRITTATRPTSSPRDNESRRSRISMPRP